MGVNVADTYIMFNPPGQVAQRWTAKSSARRRSALMTEELGKHVPGEGHLFSQPIEMRFNEILEGTRADIAVKVFGEDFAVIERSPARRGRFWKRFPARRTWSLTRSANRRCSKSFPSARR
jgi:cobalt-zinc-cadmium resistance protein CzcA